MRARGRHVGVDERQRCLTFLISARLLTYPDQGLLDDLATLRAATAELPEAIADPLRAELDRVESEELLRSQQLYVSTFDLKRRCCLYLTYYLNGDTRRRGVELWRFQQTYRQARMNVTGGELPDFLPVLLEFAADGGDALGAAAVLLAEHREGLEVLQSALEGLTSPYAPVVAVVTAVLPELTPTQRAAADQLVAHGPPTESVGLEPFNLTDITVGARS
ncbi:MAG: nitrate reductase molybdenum cofactor assembly chaperone [Actinomycetes bacterium]